MKIIKKRYKKILIIGTLLVIIIIALSKLYFFDHSTPERAIRTSLFLDGYCIKAFKTEVYKNGVDRQYGLQYSCKNPAIGADFYTCVKRNGLWFVDGSKSGGG